MSEVLYKKNFKKYLVTKYKDTNSIVYKDYQDFIDNDRFFTHEHPKFTKEMDYFTEDKFVEHFSNPLAYVFLTYVFLVVEKKEHKISIKLFTSFRERRHGKTWFKVSKNVDYITVNTLTGDIYQGYLYDYNKKRKSKKLIRKNYFYNTPVQSFKLKLRQKLNDFTDESANLVYEALDIFMDNISPSEMVQSHDDLLFKFYLDKKEIKYPNNYKVFPSLMFGKEFKKVLKKNDKKLVDALMIHNKLKGKKVKKFLHECHNANFVTLKNAFDLFGEENLVHDGNVILELLNTNQIFEGVSSDFKEKISPEELKKVYEIFKSVFVYNLIDGITFGDHVRMYTQLKNFGEIDLKWNSCSSKSKISFREEHLDWSDKIQHYRNGTYKRIYPDYFYDVIQKPIDNYLPIILDSSQSYNEESYSQNNCVKTYIGKPGSFIVSLRKDDNSRATVEYYVLFSKNSNKMNVERIQTRGKYNSMLDESWNDVLLKLDNIVLSCFKNKEFQTVKLEKTCQNGILLHSDSHFDENGILVWSERNNNSNFEIW